MVEIYLEGLKPRIEKIWKDLGKAPKKREIDVIKNNVAWNEKGRREGNWELGYDDATFDIINIINSGE